MTRLHLKSILNKKGERNIFACELEGFVLKNFPEDADIKVFKTTSGRNVKTRNWHGFTLKKNQLEFLTDWAGSMEKSLKRLEAKIISGQINLNF
jgi:hypothetical protein